MPYLPLLLFAVLYAAATAAWDLPLAVGGAYLAISLGCFVAYAIDKSAARRGEWRTPESTLLLLGLCGGWPGGLLAQQWLRHKTSKTSFQWKFYLTVVLNVVLFLVMGRQIGSYPLT
ncbi:DUF1294 domain-containing protein [Massilia sp. IC2-477]|uniref:DUF1294 domain-containing protein n=1 Tax=unclassified Massilia TaxID=2609279 RepID=UPI001D13057A|nr:MULTISPECIES: DUF1294 domain-containing protein [unclassified Massilia]MCC2954472.1 DUF1294 domain-containing protein [Massilia sp. IC2-477]MCC2971893.1 DUF1294 domain-containing protein [Massilia sp. IC2-476]